MSYFKIYLVKHVLDVIQLYKEVPCGPYIGLFAHLVTNKRDIQIVNALV